VILAVAVIAGIVAGAARASVHHHSFAVPRLSAEWLVLVAVAPQLIVFFLPFFRRTIGTEVASLTLVGSLLLLMIFVFFNRTNPAILVLGVGLLLNFLVIVANGGLMPLSPETVARLDVAAPVEEWSYGERIGGTKNVLLTDGDTRLAMLSDRFVLPAWFPLPVAYSLGDVFIAAGAFWFFWRGGAGPEPEATNNMD
jgi:hypothetical protein